MTATHLRLDGLVLGFGLSYLPVFAPVAFKAAAKSSIFVVPLALIGLIALEYAGDPWRAVLWPTDRRNILRGAGCRWRVA